ncbi:MAG TPA: TetR/AcrR family transcriptional regulator [bacterium]
MEEHETTREKIKMAALEIFVEKGYDGARMQEIADRAGANKAMIHYYFTSKDALFEAIIRETFEELFKLFSEVWRFENANPEELIPKIVHTHFQFIAEHPNLPRIIIRELNSGNPIAEKVLTELFEQLRSSKLDDAVEIITSGIASGKLRDVNPKQTLWNIVALNIFYFVFKTFIKAAWPEDVADEKQLLQQREQAVIDLLLYGLLPR